MGRHSEPGAWQRRARRAVLALLFLGLAVGTVLGAYKAGQHLFRPNSVTQMPHASISAPVSPLHTSPVPATAPVHTSPVAPVQPSHPLSPAVAHADHVHHLQHLHVLHVHHVLHLEHLAHLAALAQGP